MSSCNKNMLQAMNKLDFYILLNVYYNLYGVMYVPI